MRRFLILAGVALGLAGSAAAQILPPDCECQQRNHQYPFPASHIDIGSAVWTGSCSVTTISGQDTCVLAGTITFNYAPNPSFSPTDARWGDPETIFTPTPGTTLFFPSDSQTCSGPQGPLFNWIQVVGDLNGQTIFLAGVARWECVSGQ
jgi:hypothetical protein